MERGLTEEILTRMGMSSWKKILCSFPRRSQNLLSMSFPECSANTRNNELTTYRADNGSRTKSVGPSSAAQVFAQANPKAIISVYRAEKEEAELRREKLAAGDPR